MKSIFWLKGDQQNSQWSLNSCCFQRKMEGPCAWPMLYLEINGNDDDLLIKFRLRFESKFVLFYTINFEKQKIKKNVHG